MSGEQFRLTTGQESNTQSLSKAKRTEASFRVSNESCGGVLSGRSEIGQKTMTPDAPNAAKGIETSWNSVYAKNKQASKGL